MSRCRLLALNHLLCVALGFAEGSMCSLELKFALIAVGGGVVKVAGGPASYLLDFANTIVALAESSLETFHFFRTDWGRMISSWGVRMNALCVKQLKIVSSFWSF